MYNMHLHGRALEGISYLVLVGFVLTSLRHKIKNGAGFLAGPSGLLGAAEGLSFASVLGVEPPPSPHGLWVWTFLPRFVTGSDRNAHGVQVPGVGLLQIFLACGALEYKMHDGKMSADTMFDGGREPGDFKWDPLGTWRTNPSLAMLPLASCAAAIFLSEAGYLERGMQRMALRCRLISYVQAWARRT